jgi:4-hydroxy-3-methylbut-2-enyl diphosphate reductase
VAVAAGAEAHLLSRPEAVDLLPLAGRTAIGLSAGASTPESFIDEILALLRNQGFDRVEEMEVIHEDIHFALPPSLRSGWVHTPPSSLP